MRYSTHRNITSTFAERRRAALRHSSTMRALRDCYASLTSHEGHVIALVVSGLLNRQVAGELGISEMMVTAHRGVVIRNMKADSLADLHDDIDLEATG
jgi:FixJ family two-component response regulator